MDTYKETFDTWNKVAKLYEEKFMDLDLYDDTYDIFCDKIPEPNAVILEIGCGPGNITKYLLHKRPDFKIKGIDISPNMIALAKANNPTADFKVLDCRDAGRLKDRYDGIICGFCLPYLSASESEKLIRDCNNLLNEKGVLYLSFVEGDHVNSGFKTASSGDRAYFYYHVSVDLLKQLQDNGFVTTASYTKRYKKDITTEEEIHIIIIAGK